MPARNRGKAYALTNKFDKEQTSMSGPTISAIVPTYNRAGVIAQAIDSILSQVPAPDEVLVVDDGSTDDTAAILAQFGDRIRVLTQPNAGAAAARNHGIREARGEWLAFLDSDDLWGPGRIATFLRDITSAARDVVVHVANFTFSNSNQDVFAANGVSFPQGHATRLDAPFDENVPGPFLQCSVLRASAVEAVGGFDETLPIHEDVLLFRLLALRGAWLVTGDSVGLYRRLEDDDVALMDWESRNPVPFYRSRVSSNATLLRAEGLSASQRGQVARDLSGAQFQLAAAYAAQGARGPARAALLDSVKSHTTARTVIRALLPMLMGQRGYAQALKRRHSSLRPDVPSTSREGA